MKIKNKGFTFLELLLTISIVGIITLIIFQSTHYSMNVFRRAGSNVSLDVLKVMRQLSRDLRCGFLISKEYPKISFNGTASSMKFVSVVPLGHNFDGSGGFDLKERRYYLTPGEKNGSYTLMYSARDIGPQTEPAGGDALQTDAGRPLSSSIDSLTFAYFDGREWLPSWDSLVRLPESVRVTLRFKGGGRKNALEHFSTIILIPGA